MIEETTYKHVNGGTPLYGKVRNKPQAWKAKNVRQAFWNGRSATVVEEEALKLLEDEVAEQQQLPEVREDGTVEIEEIGETGKLEKKTYKHVAGDTLLYGKVRNKPQAWKDKNVRKARRGEIPVTVVEEEALKTIEEELAELEQLPEV